MPDSTPATSCCRRRSRIRPEDTALTLAPAAGADRRGVDDPHSRAGWRTERLPRKPQDDRDATLAPILKKEDGLIDFSRTAAETWNRLRGFQPWPGAFTTFRGKTLPSMPCARPRAMHRCVRGSWLPAAAICCAGCGGGSALDLHEIQLEGKRRMSAREFLNGYPLKPGERLGA